MKEDTKIGVKIGLSAGIPSLIFIVALCAQFYAPPWKAHRYVRC